MTENLMCLCLANLHNTRLVQLYQLAQNSLTLVIRPFLLLSPDFILFILINYLNHCMTVYLFIYLFLFRSETKMWSPLVTEEGKPNPYKMNLANTDTQVRFSSA